MPPLTPFSDAVTLSEIGSELGAAPQTKAGFHPSSVLPAPSDPARYGYLFSELHNDPANFLPQSPETVKALRDLGSTMTEPGTDAALDSTIPSAYTYFGQFVDHDITLMVLPPDSPKLSDPNLTPLTLGEVKNIRNARTPTLDLDCVYSEALHNGDDLLKIGLVTKTGNPPAGKVGDEFDVPRTGRNVKDAAYDRVGRIGDRRNTENAIITQLHVAFLRAHNAIVRRGYSYCAARTLLRRYYQLVVIHDFMNKIADPKIVAEMVAKPWRKYDPTAADFFMPLEFAAAAFRFGHSMVRSDYNLNQRFRGAGATLLRLFNVLARYDTLPEEWIIEWENFVESGTNKARRIDTQLVEPLSTLPNGEGPPINLIIQDLLRGYQLKLPVGQAVARSLDLAALSDTEIEGVAANQAQKNVLRASGFLERTPLWFYILAEAAHSKTGRLGPVGSTIVAGTLIALLRRSPDSVLNIPGWPLTMGATFGLSDLLRLADVL